MDITSTIQRIPIKDAPKVGTPTYTFRVEIDENACTGCGICVRQCPSRIIDMVEREAAPANSPASRVLDEAERRPARGRDKAVYAGPQCSETFNIACHNCHNCVSVCPESAVRFIYYTGRKDGENWC